MTCSGCKGFASCAAVAPAGGAANGAAAAGTVAAGDADVGVTGGAVGSAAVFAACGTESPRVLAVPGAPLAD